MLDDTRINQIVQQVMAEVRSGKTPVAKPDRSAAPIGPGGDGVLSDGIFPDVDSAVAAAKRAFADLNALPLELRERMVNAMRHAAEDAAQVLAHEAWSETGLGRYEDKIEKNLLNGVEIATEQLQTDTWDNTDVVYVLRSNVTGPITVTPAGSVSARSVCSESPGPLLVTVMV